MSEHVPRVSVVVPAYNVEKYIEECLWSLCAQTERDIEIIVVNDGSTDDTGSVVRRAMHADARIRLISQENQGGAAAKNRAIDNARGKYIAIQDADDFSHPARLKEQADFLDANPEAGFVGAWARLLAYNGRNAGMIRPPIDREVIREQMKTRFSFVHASILFRRTVFDDGLRYDAGLLSSHDKEMVQRALLVVEGANLPLPLYYYRMTGDQLTTQFAVGGVIRSLWSGDASRRGARRGDAALSLPRNPGRSDAERVGLDIAVVDRSVAERFEYVLRMAQMGGNHSAVERLLAAMNRYASEVPESAERDRFSALSLLYGRQLARLSPSLARESLKLVVREAKFFAHVARTNLQYRHWDYRPTKP